MAVIAPKPKPLVRERDNAFFVLNSDKPIIPKDTTVQVTCNESLELDSTDTDFEMSSDIEPARDLGEDKSATVVANKACNTSATAIQDVTKLIFEATIGSLSDSAKGAVLGEELRRLGFRHVPTAQAARLELQMNYSTPILSTAETFERWCDRMLPPYVKHSSTQKEQFAMPNTQKPSSTQRSAKSRRKRAYKKIEASSPESTASASPGRPLISEPIKLQYQTPSREDIHHADNAGKKKHKAGEEESAKVASVYKAPIAEESSSSLSPAADSQDSQNEKFISPKSRKRAAADELTGPKKKRAGKKLQSPAGKDAVDSDGKDDDGSQLTEKEPATVYEAYIAAIAKESVPDCYTKTDYDNSYKRAFNAFTESYRAAWKSFVSPTVDEKAARAKAMENARNAAKEYGGRGAVMALAIRTDKQKAADENITLTEWLAQPHVGGNKHRIVVPSRYTKSSWEASLQRARYRIKEPILREQGDSTDEEVAKQARQKAAKYLENFGVEALRQNALKDDLGRAEAAGVSLEEWLDLWAKRRVDWSLKPTSKTSATAGMANEE